MTLGVMECGTFAFECKHGSLEAVLVRTFWRPGGLGKAEKRVESSSRGPGRSAGVLGSGYRFRNPQDRQTIGGAAASSSCGFG